MSRLAEAICVVAGSALGAVAAVVGVIVWVRTNGSEGRLHG